MPNTAIDTNQLHEVPPPFRHLVDREWMFQRIQQNGRPMPYQPIQDPKIMAPIFRALEMARKDGNRIKLICTTYNKSVYFLRSWPVTYPRRFSVHPADTHLKLRKFYAPTERDPDRETHPTGWKPRVIWVETGHQMADWWLFPNVMDTFRLGS